MKTAFSMLTMVMRICSANRPVYTSMGCAAYSVYKALYCSVSLY